jgi:hypothetical protein
MNRLLTIFILASCIGCNEYQFHVLESELPDELVNEDEEHEDPYNEGEEEEQDNFDPLEEEEQSNDEEDPPAEEEVPPPADDCEDTSDLVYVIDRDTSNLYLFDPVSVEFDLLGTLDCGLWAGTPASMSVSRSGTAYVRYADDTVYAVHLESMECEETSYGSSFGHFGMGFATDSAHTWQDDLYVANANQLAKLDTETWSLNTIGGLPSQSELTGNAQGELWAILPLESPAKLVRLNKSNAQIIETRTMPSFPDPYGIDTFAFATWGGDFWVFVRTYGLGETTDVYRVSATGALSLVAQDTGLTIVGAGVSTCAPTQ